LEVKEGPQISLDIFQDPRQLRVDRLLIQDETSQANLTLTLKERTINLTFSGQLSERTLDKIFSGYPFQEGWVKGDFQAHIDVDQPMQSVVMGKIEGNHLSFPSLFEKPLEIEEVSLNAKENHITVDRANFAWGGKRLALSGDVRFSDAKVILDVSLSTESIDLDELKDLRSKKKEEGEKQGGLGLTMEGVIRFTSNSLKYERFIWEPFQANITFGQNGVEVSIEEATLCGISTPGVVKMIDQELSFDIQPFFRSRELGPTAKCLLDGEVRATGDFELKGRI
jgi:hypothetical protein